MLYFVEDDFCTINLICPTRALHNLGLVQALDVKTLNTL
jgi:hypothetical protein